MKKNGKKYRQLQKSRAERRQKAQAKAGVPFSRHKVRTCAHSYYGYDYGKHKRYNGTYLTPISDTECQCTRCKLIMPLEYYEWKDESFIRGSKERMELSKETIFYATSVKYYLVAEDKAEYITPPKGSEEYKEHQEAMEIFIKLRFRKNEETGKYYLKWEEDKKRQAKLRKRHEEQRAAVQPGYKRGKDIFIASDYILLKSSIDWLVCDSNVVDVDLNKYTTKNQVDMLLIGLIYFNKEKLAFDEQKPADKEFIFNMLIQKMNKQELELRGGLHFQDEEKDMYTGCCCGLEMWGFIQSDLSCYASPWMGHDPDINLVERGNMCYIVDKELAAHKPIRPRGLKSDRVNGVNPSYTLEEALTGACQVIGYEKPLFDEILMRLPKDFEEFRMGPLRNRVAELMSEEVADEFVEAFEKCFGMERDPW